MAGADDSFVDLTNFDNSETGSEDEYYSAEELSEEDLSYETNPSSHSSGEEFTPSPRAGRRRRGANGPGRRRGTGRSQRGRPRNNINDSDSENDSLSRATYTSLSKNEITSKMKNIFETGLAIHLSGEAMEACKAVSSPLFPHQRLALAWMFQHENNEEHGLMGGILADDMGLGKTLTVISLIMTNHWDYRPLCKPELGYTRPPLKALVTRGKGKSGGAFNPKVSSKVLGVGKKLGGDGVKKKTIGGLFDKFKNIKDSNSEKGEQSSFKFSGIRTTHKKYEEQSSNSDIDMGFDISDDEFDKMSSKDNVFKSSAKDIFKKNENPLNISEIDEVEDEMSQEEIMRSMIPTALEDDLDPKLNLDGFVDEDSDEDVKPSKSKKTKRRALDTDSENEASTSTNMSNRTRKKTKNQSKPTKKIKKDIELSDGESDISLPDVTIKESSIFGKGEPSKNDNSNVEIENIPETSSQHKEWQASGIIIPPKDPAVRAGRRRATLVVCPTSLISHWVDQLDQHLHKSVDIKLKIHHGVNKAMIGSELECHDIVITTYGTLAAEFGNEEVSPLLRAKWLRVVLDEGQNIKNHRTKSAKAAMGLDTLRRWIVTGTPIQNNLMDLWSLVNWLDFGLYAGKSQMRIFKNQIERPCKKGLAQGFERLQVLMDTICLRRTKTDRKPDGSLLVTLPNKKILTRKVVMSEEEKLCYGIYSKGAKDIVDRYQRAGQLLKNFAHIFALMTRMRQLCCHREIIKEVDWEEALRDKKGLANQLKGFLNNEDINNKENGKETDLEKRLMMQLRDLIRSGVSDDCSVCMDDLTSPVITPCAHVFCRACIEQVIDTLKPPTCPLCRGKLKNKKELLEAAPDDDENEEDNTLADMEDIHVNLSSSKVNAVLKELLRIQRDLPDDKIVIVSQFTSFLSILQPLIKQHSFSVVRLDGSMSHYERAAAVQEFQSSKTNSPQVMLLSLKAGGVGLNLTAANHLLLLDPAWNPASEWQCFDRIHRLGQKKEVTIYKYIMKDSIEEKMLDIQGKKKDLINGAFHMPADDRRMQRVDDIRNIFGV